jgi:hypothetical protein
VVRPADVTLKLAPASGGVGVEWRAEVGFESVEAFDARFGSA